DLSGLWTAKSKWSPSKLPCSTACTASRTRKRPAWPRFAGVIDSTTPRRTRSSGDEGGNATLGPSADLIQRPERVFEEAPLPSVGVDFVGGQVRTAVPLLQEIVDLGWELGAKLVEPIGRALELPPRGKERRSLRLRYGIGMTR